MKMLKKLKKNIEENKPLTQEELDNYNTRLIELKSLSTKAMEVKDYSKVLEYAKEIKKISKILKKSLKEVDKHEDI